MSQLAYAAKLTAWWFAAILVWILLAAVVWNEVANNFPHIPELRQLLRLLTLHWWT